jgi:hypothetical protein
VQDWAARRGATSCRRGALCWRTCSRCRMHVVCAGLPGTQRRRQPLGTAACGALAAAGTPACSPAAAVLTAWLARACACSAVQTRRQVRTTSAPSVARVCARTASAQWARTCRTSARRRTRSWVSSSGGGGSSCASSRDLEQRTPCAARRHCPHQCHPTAPLHRQLRQAVVPGRAGCAKRGRGVL